MGAVSSLSIWWVEVVTPGTLGCLGRAKPVVLCYSGGPELRRLWFTGMWELGFSWS